MKNNVYAQAGFIWQTCLFLKLWWIMIQRFSGWVSEKIWNLFTQNKLYFLCIVTSRVLLQTREQLQFAHWCHTDPTLCATWSITYAKATGNIAHAWTNLKFSQTTNLKTSALCIQTGSYGYLAAVVYLQRQTTTTFQPTQGKLAVAQVYDYIFSSFFLHSNHLWNEKNIWSKINCDHW